ncbi:galactose-1-phosphate uridylyltransferase [bacterium]|nr:galactose-1-phosphate uridylyltransferase [bacterium]
MSELRRDPWVDRWVIMAPERADRPQPKSITAEWPDASADDPFAEGREAETPGELLALRTSGTLPDQPGWRVRVVPNKYPAVRAEQSGTPATEGQYQSMPGIGAHEVIIECPQFETCLSRLSLSHVQEVVWTYRERLRFHRQQAKLAHILIFKNKGRAAGATLAHTHSQLMGTPWVPSLVQQEVATSIQYWHQHQRQLWTDLLQQELAVGQRVVTVGEHFVVLCPYASRFPFETRIIPRTTESCFTRASETEIQELAELLRSTLAVMTRLHPTLAYNLILHTIPLSEQETAGFRWHLEILPRIGQTAGFEWGGGCYINTVAPETAATCLQDAWESADTA